MTLQARRRGTLASLLALSFVGLFACKSETSVDAYIDTAAKDVCEAVIACSCEYPNGALYEHCLGELTVSYDSGAQINIVEGLSFDGGCADEAISQIKDLGCGVTPIELDAECEAPCKIWHGPVGKGATCTSVNGFDNCKQGLVCGGDSVCVDPCAEPKLPKIGEVCGQLLGCVEGAFCDTDADLNPVCQPLPLADQPCTAKDERCAEGLICNSSDPDNRICAVPPALGAECIDFQCAEGLYCDGSKMPAVCAAVPTLGEKCPLGGCLAPYVCNADQVCEEPGPQICGLYGGLPLADCGAGEFTCGNGACIDAGLTCDGMPQCADGSDEAPINPSCMGGGCAIDEFECLNGNCIDLASQCDNNDDCGDGSDELPFNPSCV